MLRALGYESVYFMTKPSMFRHIYVWTDVWQSTGWGAVIYLAALASVDVEQHEAAVIDGASRMQRIVHINIPAILPTIIILFILCAGQIMNVGFEKIYLMQNDLNKEVSEVIATYVYERGLVRSNFSFASAVGMFNNVVNFILLCMVNFISGRLSETSLF